MYYKKIYGKGTEAGRSVSDWGLIGLLKAIRFDQVMVKLNMIDGKSSAS